jgi:N-glycosylase/DNA lyase
MHKITSRYLPMDGVDGIHRKYFKYLNTGELKARMNRNSLNPAARTAEQAQENTRNHDQTSSDMQNKQSNIVGSN